MIGQKRDRLEMVRDLLYNIQIFPNIRSTRLMYKSNLSPQMFKSSIIFLEQEGFIETRIIFNKNSVGHKQFLLTEKGRDYLIQYKKVEEFKEKFGV